MKHVVALAILAILVSIAGTAVAQGPGPGPRPGPGPSPGPEATECSVKTMILDCPYETLSPREISDLVFAREEEKLARDVYVSLYQKWGMKVLQKVYRSEKRHMRDVQVMLDRYGIDDPVGDNGVGVFTDATLQSLYQDLVTAGSQSRIEALKVGVFVEEMNLADLHLMLRKSDNLDADILYQNLSKGSRNHLRAFYRVLTKRGATYEPIQFLSEETFFGIVASEPEKGVVDENGDWICGGWSRGRID